MSNFRMSQLYDEIYRALTRDTEFMALMDLNGADLTNKALKIQKRRQPMNIVGNTPLLSFYTPGGATDKNNSLVFEAMFVFDVYTKDDVELAQEIADRIVSIFDGEISPFTGIENFESVLEDQYESLTDLQNTYCFTSIIIFSVSLDK